MSTTSPRPMPEGGQRPLSPREGMQRLKALSCTTANIGEQRCSGQVHIGVFFDGTAVPTVQGTAEIAEFGLDGGQQPLQGGRRKAGRCRTTVVTGIGQVR